MGPTAPRVRYIFLPTSSMGILVLLLNICVTRFYPEDLQIHAVLSRKLRLFSVVQYTIDQRAYLLVSEIGAKRTPTFAFCIRS